MTRNIDELNNISSDKAKIENYFKIMDLPKKEREVREEFAKKTRDILDLIIVLILTMGDEGQDYIQYIYEKLEEDYISLINEYVDPDDYLINYASDYSYNFIDTTLNHIDEERYTSEDRVILNAVNCANDVFDYEQYKEAVEEGKTHKRWITKDDSKVRLSHKLVNPKPIRIDEKFLVGSAWLLFPKDYENAGEALEEVINCRCKASYIKEDERYPYIRDDVTEEYQSLASPFSGTYAEEDKFEDKMNEREIAKWLFAEFGGNITAREERKGQKNPDYLWRDKLWDLKTVSSEKAANKAIQSAIGQIKTNPGGAILYYKNFKPDKKVLYECLDERMKWHDIEQMDIIIKEADKYEVLRYWRIK